MRLCEIYHPVLFCFLELQRFSRIERVQSPFLSATILHKIKANLLLDNGKMSKNEHSQ